jgi:uncharacterized protein
MEEPKMRKDISFKTDDGLTLRGWHYLPDGRSGKVPTIVMAHGFSAVKEMYLDRFAEAFAAAGLAAVVFDNRNFGASDGEPRQEIDPWKQVRDYRDAITYAQGLSDTNPDRIGIWGSSYSGGHVIVVGAIDRRVKCVVSQVPLASGHENARRLVRADYLAGLHAAFDEDRRARMKGSAPAMIPVVAEDPAAPSALPTPDKPLFYSRRSDGEAVTWSRRQMDAGRLWSRLRQLGARRT